MCCSRLSTLCWLFCCTQNRWVTKHQTFDQVMDEIAAIRDGKVAETRNLRRDLKTTRHGKVSINRCIISIID